MKGKSPWCTFETHHMYEMANSIDPDQMWVYAVCPDLSVWKLLIIPVIDDDIRYVFSLLFSINVFKV